MSAATGGARHGDGQRGALRNRGCSTGSRGGGGVRCSSTRGWRAAARARLLTTTTPRVTTAGCVGRIASGDSCPMPSAKGDQRHRAGGDREQLGAAPTPAGTTARRSALGARRRPPRARGRDDRRRAAHHRQRPCATTAAAAPRHRPRPQPEGDRRRAGHQVVEGSRACRRDGSAVDRDRREQVGPARLGEWGGAAAARSVLVARRSPADGCERSTSILPAAGPAAAEGEPVGGSGLAARGPRRARGPARRLGASTSTTEHDHTPAGPCTGTHVAGETAPMRACDTGEV